jgi:DNA phosphorothioation-dependent restriction protein DptH
VNAKQRAWIIALLDQGRGRDEIAVVVGVTVNQVSAVRAHRTMGTYGDTPTKVRPASIDAVQRNALRDIAVPLGVDLATREPVSWEVTNSANPHLLIVGESGFGKTYAIQCILSELASEHVAAIVFDFGQGFIDTSIPKAHILDLGRSGVALNPLVIHSSDIHGPVSVAQRVADAFARVYPRLGIQQHAILRAAILDAFGDVGITDDAVTWTRPAPALPVLQAKLEQYAMNGEPSTKRIAASVASHVATLFVFNVFRDSGAEVNWPALFESGTTILAFRGLEPAVAKLATEFLLWHLIQYSETAGLQRLRAFVVLDEAHRLSSEDGSPVEKLLREARKFGIGLILASQQPEDFTNVAISNTATKLVFQVTDPRATFARMLGRKTREFSWPQVADVITRLPKGHAYFLGGNSGRVVAITSLEDRHLDVQVTQHEGSRDGRD